MYVISSAILKCSIYRTEVDSSVGYEAYEVYVLLGILSKMYIHVRPLWQSYNVRASSDHIIVKLPLTFRNLYAEFVLVVRVQIAE